MTWHFKNPLKSFFFFLSFLKQKKNVLNPFSFREWVFVVLHIDYLKHCTVWKLFIKYLPNKWVKKNKKRLLNMLMVQTYYEKAVCITGLKRQKSVAKWKWKYFHIFISYFIIVVVGCCCCCSNKYAYNFFFSSSIWKSLYVYASSPVRQHQRGFYLFWICVYFFSFISYRFFSLMFGIDFSFLYFLNGS